MENVALVLDSMTSLVSVSRRSKNRLDTAFTEDRKNCDNWMVSRTNTKTGKLMVKETERSYGLYELYIQPYIDHE